MSHKTQGYGKNNNEISADISFYTSGSNNHLHTFALLLLFRNESPSQTKLGIEVIGCGERLHDCIMKKGLTFKVWQ